MSDYWKNVGSKLKSIGKSLLTVGTPIAIECGIQVAIDKACDVITKKLNKVYVNSLRNSLITLFLNVIGMLILFVPVFGEVGSRIVSSLCFLGALVFFLVRQTLFIKDYGKTCLEIGNYIVQKKSIKGGISFYINNKVPTVAFVYTGIDVLSTYIPDLKRIPSIEDTVSFFIKIFRKQLIFYVSLISIYTILIYWILKPLILDACFGMNWFDMYFYPIKLLILADK